MRGWFPVKAKPPRTPDDGNARNEKENANAARSESEGQQADRTEECSTCAAETPHRVTIEIRTENEQAKHSSFSREPYRVSICVECGEETVRRMNDA